MSHTMNFSGRSAAHSKIATQTNASTVLCRQVLQTRTFKLHSNAQLPSQNAFLSPALSGPRVNRLITCAASSNGVAAEHRPTAAETARTIVDLAAHGTLCTAGDDGIPLGTYASYVLDATGQPILRLRADAVHTLNLNREPKCSLFVQPSEHPTRLLARVTLIGTVEPVPEEVATNAAELHATLHAGGVGVDAPMPDDRYYRLMVERGFYVGQLSGDSQAEVIPGDEYRAAEPDPLRSYAQALTQHMNSERQEDVLRIGCQGLNIPFEDMYYAELLWVDRLGIYLKAMTQDGLNKVMRVTFPREVTDERDVKSALTMMAQVAWEKDRTYVPVAIEFATSE